MNKLETKRLKKYLELHLKDILDGRQKILNTGSFLPAYLYLSDKVVWPKRRNGIMPPIKIHAQTEMELYGMKVILDFRIPIDHFYMTSQSFEKVF